MPERRDDQTMPATGLQLAFLLHNLNGGGVQRMMVALARCCRDRGHTVDILVCREADIPRVAVPEGVRLLRLDLNSRRLQPIEIARFKRSGCGL